ncbi:hypothetical protein CLOM_g5679 [Closterium sp. NIES-68]|nr:hypothetical protein CLOM_g5679 [Closterium sp. NIES-68]GJP64033.1 hypothetical protein CLOP_g21067 [Closterium sp. NIES-67]
MAVSFGDLSTPAGLKQLDEYLLTRSYISGFQASRDDLTVYSALKTFPKGYTNAARWYTHIKALLGSAFAAPGVGVVIGGAAPAAAASVAAVATPPAAEAKPAEDEEDDDDLDLFGEATEEEKAAAAEREAKAAASGKKKESGKSSVLLDVKPWDDETDMAKLEAAVRKVEMDGLLWGASKLVPVGYGIKKLTIMMTIVDDLVSLDELIEDHLQAGECAEFIQSCDIVAFNKI